MIGVKATRAEIVTYACDSIKDLSPTDIGMAATKVHIHQAIENELEELAKQLLGTRYTGVYPCWDVKSVSDVEATIFDVADRSANITIGANERVLTGTTLFGAQIGIIKITDELLFVGYMEPCQWAELAERALIGNRVDTLH